MGTAPAQTRAEVVRAGWGCGVWSVELGDGGAGEMCDAGKVDDQLPGGAASAEVEFGCRCLRWCFR